MKILLATVLLWSGMFISQLQAQKEVSFFGDTLNIFDRNETYARLISKDIHKLAKTTQLADLLTSFFGHLELVKESIPDYSNYQIIYDNATSLRVEEVTGVTKYRIGKDQQLSEYKQNLVHLKDNNLHVFLYFDELEDLATQKFTLTISNALEEIRKTKLVKKIISVNLLKTYNYSYSENRLLKYEEIYPSRRRLNFISSGSIGLFKDQPIYEGTIGFGLFVGARRNGLVYLSNVLVYQYDEEKDKMQKSEALEVGFLFFQQAAIKLAFPYNKGRVFNDIDYRMSINLYPRKNMSIGLQIYQGIKSGKVFPGISFGFGI